MSFADGWPRCQKILEMILCRLILSLAHCDLFAAMHILLKRSIALVNPGSSRAQLHLRSGLAIFILDEDSQGKGMEHVAVRAHPGFLQQTEFILNSKPVSELEKGWCQVSHHTHHTAEALEKKAQGSQRCPRCEVEV